MKFKNKTVAERWSKTHPMLKTIIQDGAEYMMQTFGLEIVLTETATTKAEDDAVGRIEATHRDEPWSRAVDVRNRDWTNEQKLGFCTYLTEKYGHLGAISSKSKKKTLIYDKNHGTGPHFHIQVYKGAPV